MLCVFNSVSLELLEAWPIKCAYAVQEMFKTESDYVKDLHDIIQVCARVRFVPEFVMVLSRSLCTEFVKVSMVDQSSS